MKFDAKNAFCFAVKWSARYATFPLNMVFAGDTFEDLKSKEASNSKFAFLTNNPVTRFFSAFVIIMGVNQGVQQLSALSFDDIQTYLKQSEFSETVIKDFEHAAIRVRGRDRWGSLHTFHDLPPFMSILRNGVERIENDALPTYNTGLGTLLNTNKYLKMVKPYLKGYLNRMATLPKEGATAEEMISQLGEVPLEMVNGLEVSDLKLKQALTLYVFRMLDHSVEYKNFGSRSAEAFVYAFEAVGEMHNDPNFAKLALKIASIGFECDPLENYHEALMLDAYFSGKEMPSERDAKKAQREIVHLFPTGYSQFEDDVNSKYRMMNQILVNHGDQLSPLAKRQAELFVASAEYFAPSLKQSRTRTSNILAN